MKAALHANPKPESAEDLRFLGTLFDAYQPLLDALRDIYVVRAQPGRAGMREALESARRHALQADELAARTFPEPVDPVMGEIRSLRTYPRRLADAMAAWGKDRRGKVNPMKPVFLLLMAPSLWAAPSLLPTPHYVEMLPKQVHGPFAIEPGQKAPMLAIAANILRRNLANGRPAATIHLWDYSADP